MDIYNSFKRMEVSKDSVERLESWKKSLKPSRVWQHNFLLVQLQSLGFGSKVHLVVSFLMS